MLVEGVVSIFGAKYFFRVAVDFGVGGSLTLAGDFGSSSFSVRATAAVDAFLFFFFSSTILGDAQIGITSVFTSPHSDNPKRIKLQYPSRDDTTSTSPSGLHEASVSAFK